MHPEVALAHPLDGGRAAVMHRSLERTVEQLGADGPAYRRLMAPLAAGWEAIAGDLLGPLRPPRHPIAAARFGRNAMRSASGLARSRFADEPARALFAGNAAHAMLPLTGTATAAYGLMLQMLGHGVGWPAAAGGSQTIADAMAGLIRSLGGEIETGRVVTSAADLTGARAVLFDLTPRQIVAIAGGELPAGYRRALDRYRYGPGVFKIDYALSGPMPWTAAECRQAGVVHVGGTLEEIAAAEAEVSSGREPARPFVLVAQQSLFDDARAPAGKHTLWAYCHVPNGSAADMTGRHRGAAGAVRARLPRPGAGTQRDGAGGHAGAQRQLHRGRHQRRLGRPAPAVDAAGCAHLALHHTQPAAVRVLVVHAAGRRRARHVRLACGAGGAGTCAAVNRP